jgi:hypothetical protein
LANTTALLSAVTSKGDHQMFQLIAPNISQSQGRDPSGRLRRQAKAIPMIAAAAAIAVLASSHTSARAADDSSQMARVRDACAVVLGLHQPGDLYDTCIRSLNKSLSAANEARLAKSEQSVCAQRGLSPGTSAFAVCEVTQNSTDE